jgi:hypothetical protein
MNYQSKLITNQVLNLGYTLLHSTSDGEMKKKIHLKKNLFSYIYKIQIVQNIAQLSSKGSFNHPPLFLIHLNFGSN